MIDWLENKFFDGANVKKNGTLYLMGIYLCAVLTGTFLPLIHSVSGWFVLPMIMFGLMTSFLCAAVDITLSSRSG